MSTAKIEFALGVLSFSGEASEQWLAEQLDKLLAHAQAIPVERINNVPAGDAKNVHAEIDGIASLTLAAFLQKHSATTNQTKKFLATAIWAMAKQAKTTFTTKDVTSAITKAQQGKLGNASQCLANALKSGQVEKGDGGECYVTPEGYKAFGIVK